MKKILTFLLAFTSFYSFSQIEDAGSQKQKNIKNNFVCEVHFFDGNYLELNQLEDFKGDYNQVKRISILFKGITSLPSNLSLFNNVQILDLSNNKLTNLNAGYFLQFQYLNELYLNNNLISDEEINLKFKPFLPNVKVFNTLDIHK